MMLKAKFTFDTHIILKSYNQNNTGKTKIGFSPFSGLVCYFAFHYNKSIKYKGVSFTRL